MTTEIILSFLTGIGLTLIGVLVTHLFQKYYERHKQKEKIRYDIYMNLIDIYAYYFWVMTAELDNERLSEDIIVNLRDLSFKTSEKLRQVNDIEFQDEILEILFSQKYAAANERYEALNEILTKLDKLVNPKFIKKMKQISEENVRNFFDKPRKRFNAPANLKNDADLNNYRQQRV
jgi:hypothetical protein